MNLQEEYVHQCRAANTTQEGKYRDLGPQNNELLEDTKSRAVRHLYLFACCRQVRPDVWERSLLEGHSHERSLCGRLSRCAGGTAAVFQSDETNTIYHNMQAINLKGVLNKEYEYPDAHTHCCFYTSRSV